MVVNRVDPSAQNEHQDVCAASMRQLITVDCKGAANGACENDVTEGIYQPGPSFATCYLKATAKVLFLA